MPRHQPHVTKSPLQHQSRHGSRVRHRRPSVAREQRHRHDRAPASDLAAIRPTGSARAGASRWPAAAGDIGRGASGGGSVASPAAGAARQAERAAAIQNQNAWPAERRRGRRSRSHCGAGRRRCGAS